MDREKKMEFQGNSSGTPTEDPRTPNVTVHTQAGKQQKMKDLLLHDK